MNLCSSCGLCCDGTLFNAVTLLNDEAAALARLGAVLGRSGAQPGLPLPCSLHTGTSCSIYAQRPASCARYRCDVLKAVEGGALTFSEGLAIVRDARTYVTELRAQVRFEPGVPLAASTWQGVPFGLSPAAAAAWRRVSRHLEQHFLGSLLAAANG